MYHSEEPQLIAVWELVVLIWVLDPTLTLDTFVCFLNIAALGAGDGHSGCPLSRASCHCNLELKPSQGLQKGIEATCFMDWRQRKRHEETAQESYTLSLVLQVFIGKRKSLAISSLCQIYPMLTYNTACFSHMYHILKHAYIMGCLNLINKCIISQGHHFCGENT